MSGIMESYSCIAQLSFEGTYGMFLLCYDDLCNEYVYVLCLWFMPDLIVAISYFPWYVWLKIYEK